MRPPPREKFAESWRAFLANADAFRLLTIIALGTAGFGMADVLLEPFGGQALAMSVAGTTKLTAVMALGGLVGFGVASRVLGFGHGTLTATMRAAPKEQVGLALGTWGAVQATAAGLAVAIGGVMRDVILGWSEAGRADAGSAYLPVFILASKD